MKRTRRARPASTITARAISSGRRESSPGTGQRGDAGSRRPDSARRRRRNGEDPSAFSVETGKTANASAGAVGGTPAARIRAADHDAQDRRRTVTDEDLQSLRDENLRLRNAAEAALMFAEEVASETREHFEAEAVVQVLRDALARPEAPR